MKINPELIEGNTERIFTQSEQKKRLLIKSSLEFTDSNLEKIYLQGLIISKKKNSDSFSFDKHLYFLFSMTAICIIYSISYVFSYTGERSLVFQLLFLNLSGLLTVLTFEVINKNWIKSCQSTMLLISYLSFNTSLVLNSDCIQELFFSQAKYSFSCIFGLISIMLYSKFIVIFKFKVFFLAHFCIGLLYLVFHLKTSQKFLQTLTEFFVYFLLVVLETIKFYYVELAEREKFLFNKDLDKAQDGQPLTEMELITSSLNKALILITKLVAGPLKSERHLKTVQDIIQKILLIFSTKENLYEINLEHITSNLDQEDQIFLKQYASPIKPSSQSAVKAEIRKTFDFPKNYEVENLIGVLKQIGKIWNFDMFFLSECTQNKPVLTLSQYTIGKYRLDEIFEIPEIVVITYFSKIEKSYKENPYHNSTHAADVLSSFLFLMHQSALMDEVTDYEIFSGIVSCLGHDVGHPGLTNRFLINSRHKLSVKCKKNIDNDVSVLEMMHCSITFSFMSTENSNILQSVSRDQYLGIRQLVIEMILATDMSKHFELLGKLKTKINASPHKPIDTPEHRLEILRIIIKAADVGHAGKSAELHKKWTELIVEEFFAQGEKEKEMGLPVSMYCDKDKTNVPKAQIGFIKNIVLPIFENLNEYLSSENIRKDCIEQIKANMHEWGSEYERKRVMTVIPEHPDEHTPIARTYSNYRNSSHK